MTNAEATITENAATVAEQGAHVGPEKASPKKGAQKKSAPKGQKAAKGGQALASPKKEAKAGKKTKPPAGGGGFFLFGAWDLDPPWRDPKHFPTLGSNPRSCVPTSGWLKITGQTVPT
jgi:hypothetical protein